MSYRVKLADEEIIENAYTNVTTLEGQPMHSNTSIRSTKGIMNLLERPLDFPPVWAYGLLNICQI